MKSLTIVALLLLLSGCFQPQDVCQYRGKQIVEKMKDGDVLWIKVRQDGYITTAVYLTEYDWNRFNLGDTIHCP
jgi:PBP1b-binding outer membrane lipoprotein LpoB